ncbi:MAG: hypothetical protein ACFE0I_10605 [Elainellaceae cyanobacterium]
MNIRVAQRDDIDTLFKIRTSVIENLFRDAQGARYHPLREVEQRKLSGKLALGCDQALL